MLPRNFTIVLLLFCINAMAVPVLERTVTVNASQAKVESVLKLMEEQAQFSFSYNASRINTQSLVSINVSKKTVRETLYLIFQNNVSFKAKGNYVILSPSEPKVETGKAADDPIIIWGYVSDSLTKQKIAFATVYEKKSLKSTLTNEYGYFTLVLNHTTDTLELLIQKESFTNVTVNTKPSPDLVLNIVMVKPVKEVEQMVVANSSPVFDTPASTVPIPDTSYQTVKPSLKDNFQKSVGWLTPLKSKFMLNNVSDSFNRDFQISFVPFFGTNGLMSGSITNKVSINIIGGFNGGASAVEAGGVFNLIRRDMHGAQLAGIFNVVGRETKGLQAAGIFNSNFGNTQGLQAAGIFNNNMGSMNGIQLAGIFNNNFKETNAIQAAGILNNTFGNFTGLQVAGIGNSAFKEFKGAQLAGIYNFALKDVNGIQVSGITNVSVGGTSGGQISGILNISKNVKRFQLGLINISDTCEGIPIGYFSFVRKGYHKFEISGTETGIVSASFRTGVTKFHNIFSLGLPMTKANQGVWTYGYGIGTSKTLNAKNNLDVDLSYTKLNKGTNFSSPNNIYTLYVGVDHSFFKHGSLSYGLTLNDHMLDPINSDFNLFENFSPYTIYKNLGKYQNKMWVGAKVGLRI